jgi:hypothetical protein
MKAGPKQPNATDLIPVQITGSCVLVSNEVWRFQHPPPHQLGCIPFSVLASLSAFPTLTSDTPLFRDRKSSPLLQPSLQANILKCSDLVTIKIKTKSRITPIYCLSISHNVSKHISLARL